MKPKIEIIENNDLLTELNKCVKRLKKLGKSEQARKMDKDIFENFTGSLDSAKEIISKYYEITN